MARKRSLRAKRCKDAIQVIVVLLLIGLLIPTGWWIERNQSEDDLGLLIPDSLHLSNGSGQVWEVRNVANQPAGFICKGAGNGYGGRLSVAVWFGLDSAVRQSYPLKMTETPAFRDKVLREAFLDQYRGYQYANTHAPPKIDIISGATLTSEALNSAVMNAHESFTGIKSLKESGWSRFKPTRNDYILIILFILSWISTMRFVPRKRLVYWIILVLNLLFLGYIAVEQISVSQITRLLYGDLPSIETNLIFYLLLSGALLTLLFLNKNIYCNRVCPFGAAQQIIHKISGAKTSKRPSAKLLWIPRLLSLALLLYGISLHDPTRMNYEVFPAFFNLSGSMFHFALLFAVLFASLFVLRPWCNYLCPVKPVFDFVKKIKATCQVSFNRSTKQ